jgi:hypothetical protein
MVDSDVENLKNYLIKLIDEFREQYIKLDDLGFCQIFGRLLFFFGEKKFITADNLTEPPLAFMGLQPLPFTDNNNSPDTTQSEKDENHIRW